MFCQNCGKEIPEDAKFCANCGTKLKNLTTENKNTSTQNVTEKLEALAEKKSSEKQNLNMTSIKSVKKNQNSSHINVGAMLLAIPIVFGIFYVLANLSVGFSIEEKTRGFDSSLGHCNVSIYYNTSEYSEEKIKDLLNNFENAPVTSGDVRLYFGTSKRYMVSITNSLLGARVEAYQYGDNDYQETLFNEVYSNYNEAKEKFDSLCKKCKSEITWKFWKW